MKTLILYASTDGYAENCAKSLATELGGQTDIVNIGKAEPSSLAGHDAVILGSSIYMGQINKKLKEYMDSHIAELRAKRLGLFLCSGLPENLEQNYSQNFPQELLDAAIARQYFGGVLDKSKMSLGHKMITKMMESVNKKEGKSGPAPKPENIAKLAEAMR